MRAEIRGIHSSDVDNLAQWVPASASFAVTIRLMIGPSALPGEESFDLTVCSAAWLDQQALRTPVYDARNHLVVHEFNWGVIRDYIERQVSAVSGDTWDDVAQTLSRFAYWEFEDYE